MRLLSIVATCLLLAACAHPSHHSNGHHSNGHHGDQHHDKHHH